MLVIALRHGAETTLTDTISGQVIKLTLARGGQSPRVGIQCEKRWNVLRSDAIKRTPPHSIQVDLEQVQSLGLQKETA